MQTSFRQMEVCVRSLLLEVRVSRHHGRLCFAAAFGEPGDQHVQDDQSRLLQRGGEGQAGRALEPDLRRFARNLDERSARAPERGVWLGGEECDTSRRQIVRTSGGSDRAGRLAAARSDQEQVDPGQSPGVVASPTT